MNYDVPKSERVKVADVMSDALVYLNKRYEENPTPDLRKIIEKFNWYINYAHGDYS